MSNEIAKTNNNAVGQTKIKFTDFMSSALMKKKINEIIGDEQKGARFVSSIISAVNNNPSLAECDNASILSGALLGEALNLSPSPQLGQYYLVGYKNAKKGTVDAQFQMGWHGYYQLAIRSGQYKDLDVIEIKEGEYKGRDKLTGKQTFEFIEDETERLSKETIGYLGYFELLNGYRKQIYMSKEEMEKHADTYSKAFSLADYKKLKAGQIPEKDMWKYSSYWYKDFDGMAFKTVLRRLISKYGVMSIDMQEAYTKDMAVLHEDDSIEYVDNPLEDEKEVIKDANVEEKVEPKTMKLDDVE